MAVNPLRRRQVTPYEDEILKRNLRQVGATRNQYANESYGGNFPIGTLTSDILKGLHERGAKEELKLASSDTDKARALVMQLTNNPNINIASDGTITEKGTQPTDVQRMNYSTVDPKDVTVEALTGTADKPTSYSFGEDPSFLSRVLKGRTKTGETTDNIYDIMNKAQIPFKSQVELLSQSGEPEFTYERDSDEGVTTEYKINKKTGEIVGKRVVDDLSESRDNKEYTIVDPKGQKIKVQGQSVNRKLQLFIDGLGYVNADDLTKRGYKNIQEFKEKDIRKERLPGTGTVADELGKGGAKLFNTDYQNSVSAIGEVRSIDDLLTIVSREDTPSGTFGNFIPEVMKLGKSLGFISADAPNTIENARLVQTQLAERTLANVKKLTGPITEKELRFLQEMVPSLKDTKEGQIAILLYSQYIYNKQANFSRYVEENHPNYEEGATGASLNRIRKGYMESDEGNKSFLNFVLDKRKQESDFFRKKLDSNSPMYDPNYTQQQFNDDLDYLTNNKYNLPYVRKVFRRGK